MIFVRILLGADFPAQTKIGKMILPHGAAGIFININAKIEDDVTIFHQVTIGVANDINRAPTIKRGVLIGAGAKILGNITVEEGSKIGANAVLLNSTETSASD